MPHIRTSTLGNRKECVCIFLFPFMKPPKKLINSVTHSKLLAKNLFSAANLTAISPSRNRSFYLHILPRNTRLVSIYQIDVF